MKSVLFFVLILSTLLLIDCKAPLDFQAAFWPNFWADMFIATIFGVTLTQLTDLLKKPKLSLVAKQNGIYDDVIKFTKQGDGSSVADFQLAIKNNGNLTIKKEEGFWHTYITTDESVTPLTAMGELNHQRGLMEYSIYPKSFTDISGPTYHLVVKNNEKLADGIRYFFSTDYGYFPRTVRLDQKSGRVEFKTMGLLKFETESGSNEH